MNIVHYKDPVPSCQGWNGEESDCITKKRRLSKETPLLFFMAEQSVAAGRSDGNGAFLDNILRIGGHTGNAGDIDNVAGLPCHLGAGGFEILMGYNTDFVRRG